MSDDFAAVAQALQTYFDGLYESDTKLLRQIFHPNARYVTATAEPMVDMDMKEYFALVDKRPAPASRGELRQDRIVSIDFAGATTAAVRLNCAIGERYCTDLLTLIKIDGRWLIIAKVFHYDIIEPVTA